MHYSQTFSTMSWGLHNKSTTRNNPREYKEEFAAGEAADNYGSRRESEAEPTKQQYTMYA